MIRGQYSEIERLWEQPIEAAEFHARVEAAVAELDGPEYENVTELIRWFSRRYPTPEERFRAARRKRQTILRSF